jgi:transposase
MALFCECLRPDILRRWQSFTVFLDDDRVAIDNSAAERALRPVAIGRKN